MIDPSNVVALPIWNAEELTERPNAEVMITSGAEAALAAQQFFPSFVCLAGPLSADWSILKGRAVRLWPDAGEIGEAQMRTLAATLQSLASRITLHSQAGMQSGWNLSHALKEDWTKEEVMLYTRREGDAHIRLLKASTIKAVKREKPAIEAKPLTAEPEIDLQRDHLARPFCTDANALRLLQEHPKYAGRIWFDDFAQRLMIDEKRFEKKTEGIACKIWMQQAYAMHNISENAIGNAALHYGHAQARHVLRDYLEAIKWDGADRLSGFMANVYGAERNAYSEAVGRCWLVSAIARIYEPGCKADCMLVLEGGQGIYKSTSLSLLGAQWFMESHEDPLFSRKDFLGQLQGHWIIEVPEMHSIAGAVNGIEKIKGIISCQVDDYRRPWGDTSVPYPRQCIFAGTTNLRQWNSDPTGGRRFWPILCGHIDLDYLKANRDQLWAEAVSRYKAHEKWWDVPVDDAREQQDLRRRGDVWEPIIEKYVTHIPMYHEDRTCTWEKRTRPLEYLQVHRILSEAINKQVANWSRADEMRVASILGVLGYERHRETIEGSRAYIYRPTVSRPVESAPVAQAMVLEPDDDSVPY